MIARQPAGPRKFFVELIHPSRYDDDGYVVQWWRAWIPSNALACLYGLMADSAQRRVLGDDVDIVVHAYEEPATVIAVDKIVRRIRAGGGSGLICMVGVQTNQFPRALDLARQFRQAGLPVIIGGFHVSGCLRMLADVPEELKQAMAEGIALFAGEAEGRVDSLLADAYDQRLKPLYNYLDEPPELGGQPIPVLPDEITRRSIGHIATIDMTRGCPFKCKFCAIVNVQGRTPRSRTPDDVEKFVRLHYARGYDYFFLTDDNFARSSSWEPILDRLIQLRQQEGIRISFLVQLDAMAYKIPRLVEKLGIAGCRWVFVGIETVNPENLAGAGKLQNHVEQYRPMLQAWHSVGIRTHAGYMLGFPADTPDSIRRDMETLKHDLPLDVVKFACVMPLPGSVDHRDQLLAGEWMDPDLNRYTGEKAVTHHPRMSREQWEGALAEASETFWSEDCIATTLQRCRLSGRGTSSMVWQIVHQRLSRRYERVCPLECGLGRRKVRTQRRPGLPWENPLLFYPRRVWECLSVYISTLWYAWRLFRLRRRIESQKPADSTWSKGISNLDSRASQPRDPAPCEPRATVAQGTGTAG